MSDSELVRPRRRWRSIVTGVACFVFGSMLVVQADPLPDKRRVGLVDANDEGRAVRVNADGQLETADGSTHDRLDNLINVVRSLGAEEPLQVALATSRPLTVDVPHGIEVNNFPATQAVTGSVSIANLPATQAVTGAVSITNMPYVQVLPTTGYPLKAEVTIPGTVFTQAADDMMPFEAPFEFTSVGNEYCRFFTVPAPRRLVIETITASGLSGRNPPSIKIYGRSAGQDMTYSIATNFTPPYDDFLDTVGDFSATHSVKLRLDTGTHRVCMFATEGALTISGYLR
jgi:hypothetical protein